MFKKFINETGFMITLCVCVLAIVVVVFARAVDGPGHEAERKEFLAKLEAKKANQSKPIKIAKVSP
jgi:hypothetical protein